MSRTLTATVIFQSYIALGLEPGAAWDEILARHKDLIMAWHPDRFADDKQKAKAESELKKINAARDTLRKHFQSEHKPGPRCTCRPQTNVAETNDNSAAASSSPNKAAQAAGRTAQEASRIYKKILKSPFVATLLLIGASLGTIAVYHESTKLRASEFEHSGPPQGSLKQAPIQQVETPASPVQPGRAAPAQSPPQDDEDLPILPGSSAQKHSADGTFYSSFLARQEKRMQQEAEARHAQLEKELSRLRESTTTAINQLAECERRLVLISNEISEQQAVLGELAGVDSDLQTANGSLPADSSQLYYSNADYRKKADVLMNMEKQKAGLTAAQARLKQQVEQNKVRISEINLELNQP